MPKKLAWILLILWLALPRGASAGDLEEFAYIGSQDNSIRVTDLDTGANFRINSVYEPERIFTTPDKRLVYVLMSRRYGGLVPIDATTHQVRSPSSLYSRHVTTMAFSPDSQRGYVGLHNSYQTWISGQCAYGGGLRTISTATNQEIGCQDFGERGPGFLSEVNLTKWSYPRRGTSSTSPTILPIS
jgi:DNA-binding beta-propeller fold protein YncE